MAMAVSSALLSIAIYQKRHAAIVSAASVSPDLAIRNGSRISLRVCRCAAKSEDGEASTSGGGNVNDSTTARETEGKELSERSIPATWPRKRGDAPSTADSTDCISSNLTRRFGLGAELVWVGVLAFGVILEQVKTRNKVFREEQESKDVQGSKEVTLPNGICCTDLRKGGGSIPQRGDLVVIYLTRQVASSGDVFIVTTANGKRPAALIFGAKPYSSGMCDSVEYVLNSTRFGEKRRVTIPAALAFGETGTTLNTGVRIPGIGALEYVVELQKAFIAPS